MVISLQRRIDRALGAGAASVVLDLDAVTVLGDQSVSLLCGALRRLTRRGATITIAGGPQHLKRVLERCAIDRLEHYASGEAALLAALLRPPDRLAPHKPPSHRGSAGAPQLAFSQ